MLKLFRGDGKRMLDTINDLIDILKIESGTLDIHYSKV